jgi:hypothetical protein
VGLWIPLPSPSLRTRKISPLFRFWISARGGPPFPRTSSGGRSSQAQARRRRRLCWLGRRRLHRTVSCEARSPSTVPDLGKHDALRPSLISHTSAVSLNLSPLAHRQGQAIPARFRLPCKVMKP